ncbi:phospholipid-translocating P-type ATPase [Dacryopinax primogenitus]|uniref:Phospholipid-transporting ATPase n=1 Tax=Dacryopinax primogenitus (strain DJM 731) TaxID=1858805 RepID=M5G3F4_DACPD|nr:phospholipid-translocating P-type ATPase [Dacryopinax primogenitus]EJT98292.1 phospholipid-translocating P-type ATPase [Dacryopinax primogenitus]
MPPRHISDAIEEDDQAGLDNDLRLRTVRTAASTLAESVHAEARMVKRRKTRRLALKKFFKKQTEKGKISLRERKQGAAGDEEGEKVIFTGERRRIYVNGDLPLSDLDHHGDLTARYPRNKIRTSKYTILSFIPKNLFEQFRRVANIYFLVLVVFQVFPMFGSATPQIAMLPLVFILCVTAIKDGIEDYRRARLDEEVNNSATTKLGQWRNVNRAKDPRTWFEKLRGVPHPDKITRGVRKLRERDHQSLANLVLVKSNGMGSVRSSDTSFMDKSPVSVEDRSYADDATCVTKDHLYPPTQYSGNVSTASIPVKGDAALTRTRSSAAESSHSSRASAGVMDWEHRSSGTAQWERTLWKKLYVGDIVLLRENDQVPADIIVLSTSDADGLCYVETKNLDGETNLKPRRSLKATSTISSDEDLEHATFVIDSEPPHANLYTYKAVLRYASKNETGSGQGENKVEPVTINELLLRGCTLRNTDWVIGLVAFTGRDTKILLNGGDTPSKRSKIEKETNFNVIMNFVILMIMCLVTGIVNGVFLDKTGTSADYFEVGAEASSSNVVNAIVTFVSCLVAFQNIVPISLYISIEIVKTIQAYFIFQDVDMYYAPLDSACVPKTWNISDDLGQIEYIFSDKTGTLTQNVMEFQRCSINGVPYGEGVTEAMKGAAIRAGHHLPTDPAAEAAELLRTKATMIDAMKSGWRNPYLQEDHLTLLSPKLIQHMGDSSNPQSQKILDFFRALALCHTVLPDRPEPREQPYLVNYKAESPDEAALVSAARDVGFPFLLRSNDLLEIQVLGNVESYQPLRVLEFNSTRKRMSVIVRNPEGQIVLYCKGADSVIYQRLAPDHNQELKDSTHRDLDTFANGGLRTLCVAYRYLSEEEFANWLRVSEEAAASVEDREDKIDDANEQIEHSLTILGATALEDKLQEGVPDAIETLHRAGIKLWILTGDKLQTAIEIGFSCNLLTSSMEVMIISADSASEARNQIEGGLNKIASIIHSKRTEKRSSDSSGPSGFAVVIDGDTLRFALSEELKPLFLTLGTQCDTVVCCRVSPAQKALTVRLVKEGRGAMTLAIGDGANDVAMIQEAHVGCGLLGKEGSQAAMSADYAFAQFRFLTKLLLVHGRWSYIRIAEMHANFFYKNVIWTVAMFWFLFWNSFDATYLFEYTFILLDNLAFTSLPVIVMGAFDQDVNAKAGMAFPELYKRGVLGLEYTRTKFWFYMFDGLYQSAVVYFFTFLVWSMGNPVSWNGRDVGALADFGTTAGVAALITANIYVGINTKYWTVITWVIIIGSILLVFLWIAIYSAFITYTFYDESAILFPLFNFWATVALVGAIALVPRFLVNYIQQAYFPLDKDIVREMWVSGDLKEKLGIRRRKGDRSDTPINRDEVTSDTSDPESDVPLSAQPYNPSPNPTRAEFDSNEKGLTTPVIQGDFQTGTHSPVPLSYYSPSAIRSAGPSPNIPSFPASAAASSNPLTAPSGAEPRDSIETVQAPWQQHNKQRSVGNTLSPPQEYEMRPSRHREASGQSESSLQSNSTYLTAANAPVTPEPDDDVETIRDDRRESNYSYASSYASNATYAARAL